MTDVYINDWGDYENYMVSQKLCPECYSELKEYLQVNGPDDVDIAGAACTKCDYSFGY